MSAIRTAYPTQPPGRLAQLRPKPLRPYLMMLVPATLAVSMIVSQPSYPLVPLLVGLAFGSFVLAMHSPAYVLVPVIVTELTLYGYTVPMLGVAQRLAITLIAVLVTAPLIVRYGRFADPRLRTVLLPCVVFVVIATVVNSMFSDDAYLFPYLRYQIAQVLLLILVATLIRTREDLRRLAIVALVAGVLAGFVSLWQHYEPDSAPYGAATAAKVRDWNGRSIGLPSSPVALANQMTFVLLPVLGVLLCGPWRTDKTRLKLIFAMLIIAAGLNFTYTRSGVFALAPGILFMSLLLQGGRRLLMMTLVVLAVIIFPMLENTGLVGHRYFRDTSDDQSAQSHAALHNVGLAIALDNWIVGIGHEHFEEKVWEYVDIVDTGSTEVTGDDATDQRPHNDWLSVWLSWGIFALIAYAFIFLGTLWNLALASRHPDALIRGLAIGCAGGVVVYGVSSAYHNYMDSSVFLWLYAGVSVALVRLAKKRDSASPPYPPPAAQNPATGA